MFKRDPEKYKYHLLWALLNAGNKLAEAEKWKETLPYLQESVEIIKELIEKEPSYHKGIVQPALYLARGYSVLKDHVNSVGILTELCNYFEQRVFQHPEYSDFFLSLMLFLTEELLENNQKDKAADTIAKAIVFMAEANDLSERDRLEKSFEKLRESINE